MATKEETIGEKYNASVIQFVTRLKNGKLEGSSVIAMETVNLLEKIISENEFKSAAEMLVVVRAVGRRLCRALPQEGVVGNMVRRVLRIIREEYHAADKQYGVGAGAGGEALGGGASLQQLVRAGGRRNTLELPADVTAPTLLHIAEFKMDIDTSVENICSQATEHIHANELILTYGASRLVEHFLRSAAKDRTFHVMLGEGPCCAKSHQMAVNLAKSKIEVTVVADCAIMAVMSRVNKVIIGAQAVLAGGGLRAAAGSQSVALAAKHYSVPVIVLSPLYKLSCEHVCEQDDFNTLLSPEATLPYECGADGHAGHVLCPLYDYVPPNLVTLLLTNLFMVVYMCSGGNSPSYVYRLLSELYDHNDYQL